MYLGCIVRVAVCGTVGCLIAYDENIDLAHVRVDTQVYEVPYTALEPIDEGG